MWLLARRRKPRRRCSEAGIAINRFLVLWTLAEKVDSVIARLEFAMPQFSPAVRRLSSHRSATGQVEKRAKPCGRAPDAARAAEANLRLGQQRHARACGVAVERDCALASRGGGATFEQAIREIGFALLEEAQCLPGGLGILHDKLPSAEHPAHDLSHLASRSGVAAFRHPHDLDQGDQPHEARRGFGALSLDECGGAPGLDRIVLGNVTNEDIGVDPDQCAAPRERTAAFMSSTDTGVAVLRNNPFSDLTSATAGLSATSPPGNSTNSTRSPASMFRRRRTSCGMVICPLLVTVAVAKLPSLSLWPELTLS